MLMKRILLVNVGMDSNVSSIANDGSFPALGVVSLATVIRRDFPDIEVRAIDGQVTSRAAVDALILSFRPNLVGLSVLGSSYKNSVHFAEIAKTIGAITVFGNDHAISLGSQIMRKQSAVDYICTADIGEFAFVSLIRLLNSGGDISKAPSLLYRRDGEIRRNGLRDLEVPADHAGRTYVLDAIPVPDRTLLASENWDSYRSTYLARYGNLHKGEHIAGVTTMNRARGCARAKNPCNFCGIADLTPRLSSPDMFWEDVRGAIRDVDANVFYEAFDSFSSAPRWIEKVVAAKPRDIGDVKFFVYTQASETTPKLVQLYKDMGVYRVNMGLEAGDTTMLRRLKGKRDSLERNQQACILFKEAGIPIYGSLVLGGQGETYETLRNTVDFAKWLIDNRMMAALEAQPLYPDFGARTGSWLMDPAEARQAALTQDFAILDERYLDAMRGKYGDTDDIDFDEISHDWNRIFCHVSWDDLIKATAEITGYAARNNTVFGSARVSTGQLSKGDLDGTSGRSAGDGGPTAQVSF